MSRIPRPISIFRLTGPVLPGKEKRTPHRGGIGKREGDFYVFRAACAYVMRKDAGALSGMEAQRAAANGGSRNGLSFSSCSTTTTLYIIYRSDGSAKREFLTERRENVVHPVKAYFAS